MSEARDPRYPVGRFVRPESMSAEEREMALNTIAEMPEQMRAAVDDLSEEQLNTPYREGGWTLRQVVHHVADAHMGGLTRVRKALSEDWPEVFAYDESAWAKQADYDSPVEWSLELIEALHARWEMLFAHVHEDQWTTRGILHPERGRMSLEVLLATYEWHSRHHLAHITHLRTERGW
ncbi:MAG: putative metal-dependent hydrolase [Acidobacteriaceae bacterium]|nr:putative metal-dependent hydrolase [Acidobacteriaceae bacterium]